MDKKYSTDPWVEQDQDDSLQGSRPTSAPPVLELSKEQLLALRALQKSKEQLVSGISDIRLEPGYERFYDSNPHLYPFLPPPLDNTFYEALDSQSNRDEGIFSSTPEDSYNGDKNESSNGPLNEQNPKMFPPGQAQPFPQNGMYATGGLVTHPHYDNPMYNVYAFPPSSFQGAPVPGFPGYMPHFTQNQLSTNYPSDSKLDNEPEFLETSESEGEDVNPEAAPDSTSPKGSPPQKKSAAIDIKRAPIWNPLSPKPSGKQRNKNFGKVAINMDTNLSSSTDDLLKLAGGGPLQRMRVRLASYEESPPAREPILEDKSPRGIRMYDNDSFEAKKDLPGEEDYDEMVHGFGNLNMAPNAPVPIPTVGPSPPPALIPTVGQELGASDKSGPAQICRYFANGFCSRGDRCNYLHVEQGHTPNGNSILHKTRYKNGRVPIPASRYNNLNIEECVGEIAAMCLDQHGCRYLQRQLDTGDPKIMQSIFTEVNEHIVELMSDPFGNYLCQKLIEHCSEQQRLEIVKSVASDLVQISKNMHGTRAVQKLIEHLSSPEENKLLRKALKGSVVALIQDLNGNHVIQKCLLKMEPNDNQFIYDAVAQHCIQVSTHRHGCCVMQRCIDHATHDQKLQLVEEIKKTALTLVQDAFGNYVVQYALDLEIRTLPTDLIKQLQSKLHFLSKQKFSSNVVEKCLRSGTSDCVARVLREFLGEDPDGNGPPSPFINSGTLQQKLVELLQDSFGNYVIQTCLSEGAAKAPAEYLRMAALLRPYVHQLRNAPYIKRIHNLLNLPTSQHPSHDATIAPASEDGSMAAPVSPGRRTRQRRNSKPGSGNAPGNLHASAPSSTGIHSNGSSHLGPDSVGDHAGARGGPVDVSQIPPNASAVPLQPQLYFPYQHHHQHMHQHTMTAAYPSHPHMHQQQFYTSHPHQNVVLHQHRQQQRQQHPNRQQQQQHQQHQFQQHHFQHQHINQHQHQHQHIHQQLAQIPHHYQQQPIPISGYSPLPQQQYTTKYRR